MGHKVLVSTHRGHTRTPQVRLLNDNQLPTAMALQQHRATYDMAAIQKRIYNDEITTDEDIAIRDIYNQLRQTCAHLGILKAPNEHGCWVVKDLDPSHIRHIDTELYLEHNEALPTDLLDVVTYAPPKPLTQHRTKDTTQIDALKEVERRRNANKAEHERHMALKKQIADKHKQQIKNQADDIEDTYELPPINTDNIEPNDGLLNLLLDM